MNDNYMLTQKELDDLGANERISLSTDVKNIIILIKNELYFIEKNIDIYREKNKKKIRRQLNKILKEVISMRK